MDDEVILQEFEKWMANELESSSTELVFEFLQDHQMLNKKGLKLRKSFWEQFIKH